MDERPAGLASHYLYPCMLFAHRNEHVVSTVLGSCVTVCLRDPVLELGGVNHYMLPLWNGEGLPTPKYGNIAIDKLIQKMLCLGCVRERLAAKLFGGANVIGTGQGLFPVGARNIILAREMLALEGIPIIASDVGGEFGRKLIYNTRTGLALVSLLRARDGQTLVGRMPG